MLPTAAEEFGIPLAVVEPGSLGCFALHSSPSGFRPVSHGGFVARGKGKA